MPTIMVEEVIAADRYDLYALAQDYKHRLEWDSLTKRVRYDHGVVTSLMGLAAAVSFINPLRMTVEHFSLLSPSLFATNMLQGPYFFSRLLGSWRFESVAQDQTLVRLHYQFQSRWPLLAWACDPVLSWILQRDSRRALRDLKYAVENTDILRRLTHNR